MAVAQAAAAAAGVELHKPADAVLAAFGGQGSPAEICAAARAVVGQLARLGTSNPAALRSLLLN
jgi:hypothetical protein